MACCGSTDAIDIGTTVVTVEFRLELEEFLETVRGQETKAAVATRWVVSSLGALLITTLLALPLLATNVPGEAAVGLLVALPFGVLMVILPWYWNPVRIYRRHYLAVPFHTQKVEVADLGVRFTTEHDETTILWSGFQRYTETETQFALISGMLAYILPKRAFKADELDSFRDIIERRGKDIGSHA